MQFCSVARINTLGSTTEPAPTTWQPARRVAIALAAGHVRDALGRTTSAESIPAAAPSPAWNLGPDRTPRPLGASPAAENPAACADVCTLPPGRAPHAAASRRRCHNSRCCCSQSRAQGRPWRTRRPSVPSVRASVLSWPHHLLTKPPRRGRTIAFGLGTGAGVAGGASGVSTWSTGCPDFPLACRSSSSQSRDRIRWMRTSG